MNRSFAETAALLSDSGRAAIVMELLGGIALPAGQLAMIAHVSPQTASSHLARLIRGKLLAVEQQGRHRYYRIADAEVANAIESLMAIAPGPRDVVDRSVSNKQMRSLAYARTCYSHLAGEIAVKIAQRLQDLHLLIPHESRYYRVTRSGRLWFERFGIAVSERQARDPQFARRCLDWTERRHHLAGPLGASLFRRLRELKWVASVRHSRAVRVTVEGQSKLHEWLEPRPRNNDGRLTL